MSAARSTLDEIGRILREHERFAVLSHIRPDGDALGSQLALALSLQQLGKKVRVWNEDGMLEKYSLRSRWTLQFKIGSEQRLQPFAQREFGSTSTTI